MAEPTPPTTSEVFDRVADILGCKWTLAILDGIARGVNRPGRLEKELPGLTTKVLNERIHKLERFGLIVRDTFSEIPPRVEYRFTPQGKRMLDVVHQVRAFADEWHRG